MIHKAIFLSNKILYIVVFPTLFVVFWIIINTKFSCHLRESGLVLYYNGLANYKNITRLRLLLFNLFLSNEGMLTLIEISVLSQKCVLSCYLKTWIPWLFFWLLSILSDSISLRSKTWARKCNFNQSVWCNQISHFHVACYFETTDRKFFGFKFSKF